MVRRLEGAEGNMSSEWSIWQVANLNSVYILLLLVLGTMFILTHGSKMLCCSLYRLYLLSDVDGITPEIQSFSLRIFLLLL